MKKKITTVKDPASVIKAIWTRYELHQLQRQSRYGDKNPEILKKIEQLLPEVKRLAIKGYGDDVNLDRFLKLKWEKYI